MFNGWYIGIVTPFKSYYRDVYYTAVVLSLLGAVLMLCLCYILLRLSAAMIRSDDESRSKSSFLATMSHEIRTPLNAILGLSELELREELPERTRGTLEKILNSGSTLLGIINDILDISKIEAGAIEIINADFYIPSLVNDIVQLNIVRIGSKNIVLRLEIDETIPMRLCGDELRVRQVLNNLLSNAFKYTMEGFVTLQIGWERRGGDALLSFIVSDTGMGIKKEDMGKLFSEYTQLDERANRNIEGTGLGLSITKGLVELLKGTISVESEYEIGSSFIVALPLKMTGEESIGHELAENLRNFRFIEERGSRLEKLVRTQMPYGRVLIVDDVATNIDVARGLMKPYGLAVDCVSSGREAIEKIRESDAADEEHRYDVVFMDHMMPDMDGIEATRIIRGTGTEYTSNVPIIALTANALSGNREMFLSNGFNSFISKPIDIMQLDMELNRWIRDRQSEETLSMYEGGAKQSEIQTILQALDGLHIEGIDLAAGVRRYESEAAYLSILRSYRTHTPKLLDRLKFPSENSLSDYATVVHGLKGSSYGINADEIARFAQELENMATAGDIELVLKNNGIFIEKVKILMEEIKETLEIATGRASKPDGSRARLPEPNQELLLKILDGANRFKTSVMEEALDELERYEYDSGGEFVMWLREKMDGLDYHAIRDRLDELIAGNIGLDELID
jgi:CheY-like chemotaxis protein/nitrogen-specific signal transduction histidine kinase